jgi:hypothetical protein
LIHDEDRTVIRPADRALAPAEADAATVGACGSTGMNHQQARVRPGTPRNFQRDQNL